MKHKTHIKEQFNTLGDLIISQKDLDVYINFCLSNKISDDQKGEDHHILPECLFKQFENLKNNRWNCARLSNKNHFIAHYLLVNFLPHDKILYALNMMSRMFRKIEKSEVEELSKLYDEHKQKICEALRNINKGRKPTEAQRKAVSLNSKNKSCYRDSENNTFQLRTDDPRIKSGEFVHVRVGYIHPQKTIEKMRINSGVANKIPYTDGIVTKYYAKDDIIPQNFVPGVKESTRKAHVDLHTGRLHYHNPITNKNIKVFPNEVPEGFIPGRTNYGSDGNPFANKRLVKHILSGETSLIALDEKAPKYYTNTSISKLYFYKNYFGTLKEITKISGFTTCFIENCVKHPEKTVNSKNKCEKLKKEFMGVKLREFGFKTIHKNDLKIDDCEDLIWVG